MKKHRVFVLLLGVILAAGVLWGTATTTAQGQAVVTLTALDVGVAETGVVEGRIDCGAGGCGGFKVTVSFDRAMLHVEEASVGPYLGDQVFLAENTVDNPNGTVRLAAAAMAPPPAGAENVLFRLTVTGLKPGSAAVNIDALEITGTSGEILASSGQGSTVNVLETGKIPFFSPPKPGWEVAFVSDRDGNPEIYVVTADGLSTRRLTEHEADDGAPAWSPDGETIAFHTARDGSLDIYLMDANGGNLRRLTDNPAADTEPAWSPDGSQIAFVSDRDGNPEIYVMNADGTGPTRLTDNPAADTGPAWSPGGTEIAFTSQPAGGAASLFLMKTDGTDVRQIANLFGANGWYPAWAPDAQLMSFTSERDSAADIYRMDGQGQAVQQLTEKSGLLTLTDWSPDGGWIAFMAGLTGNPDLYVMDNTGTDLFRLTDNPAADYDPDWRPTAIAPCFVLIDTQAQDIQLRVGPGINRGVFGILPANQDFQVIGQAYDEQNVVWWEIDKTQIPGSESANSLWVNSEEVIEKGDCPMVARVEAPPLVYPPPSEAQPTPPGEGWGECGSCSTCGFTASECVLAPDGTCIWDPNRCYVPDGPPPDDGSGCAYISLQVDPPGMAPRPAVRYPPTNCDGGWTPGTDVTLYAFPGNYCFDHWSGCVSGSANPITFTLNSSCTATANYVPCK